MKGGLPHPREQPRPRPVQVWWEGEQPGRLVQVQVLPMAWAQAQAALPAHTGGPDWKHTRVHGCVWCMHAHNPLTLGACELLLLPAAFLPRKPPFKDFDWPDTYKRQCRASVVRAPPRSGRTGLAGPARRVAHCLHAAIQFQCTTDLFPCIRDPLCWVIALREVGLALQEVEYRGKESSSVPLGVQEQRRQRSIVAGGIELVLNFLDDAVRSGHMCWLSYLSSRLIEGSRR